MNNELREQLQAAQKELDPQFKALRSAIGALNQAVKLAGEEKLDALAMQKASVKLAQAQATVENTALQEATAAFTASTQQALDALAFEFARDLKETFERRGQTVEGRPPTLVLGDLVLNIDVAARKAQWLYGKEALTKPIALSINTIVKAYDTQRRAIVERTIDGPAFLAELYNAWKMLFDERTAASGRKPAGNRINVVDVYSKMVLNRQSARFWNAPSRSTFKDYERALFIRDLVLVHSSPTVTVDATTYRLRLGGATKSQAESSSRSIWLPHSALDGEYYADVTFEAEA
ncbi:MAG: hypothetical protein R3C14_06305 [Caldilineaceae bacterium]